VTPVPVEILLFRPNAFDIVDLPADVPGRLGFFVEFVLATVPADVTAPAIEPEADPAELAGRVEVLEKLAVELVGETRPVETSLGELLAKGRYASTKSRNGLEK
jgi:hypothetical protein